MSIASHASRCPFKIWARFTSKCLKKITAVQIAYGSQIYRPSWCPSRRAALRTCVNAHTLHPPGLWNWNLPPALRAVPINNTQWRVVHSETVLGMPRLLQANIWVIVAFHVISLAVLHVTSGFAKAYSPLEAPLAGCSVWRHWACHIQRHYLPSPPAPRCNVYFALSQLKGSPDKVAGEFMWQQCRICQVWGTTWQSAKRRRCERKIGFEKCARGREWKCSWD